MVIAAHAAAAVAIIQFWLDTALFRLIFESKAVKAIGLLLLKLALYAGAFALLFGCFREYAPGAAIGFGVGFFPAVLIYGLVFAKRGLSVESRKSEVGSQAVGETEKEEQ
ncbi:MAG: hypothetical protein IJK89_01620 [Clostridia bacterium]|nr:hypothetical protein [Clostridia bacterium]